MKKLLMIVNPMAGTRKAARYLAEIADVFCRGGYETVIATTTERGDGTKIARDRSHDADVVVAIGGDGTFNEVVAGVIESGSGKPIGYIPAGTTNDFGASIGLSGDLVRAAKDIVTGGTKTIDIGSFNGRYFSYVASFGAFTSTSYQVPQSLKNILGHTAYILEGARDVLNIKSENVRIKNEVGVYGGKYIFGAVCNSTSMGGILSLSEDVVDMNDGQFEVLLIRTPSNIIELNQVIFAITSQNYSLSSLISFFSSAELEVTASEKMPWTLDGEYQQGASDIIIRNHKSAINLIVPEHKL